MSRKIKLVMTCGACPEQYDAYDGDEQVGYLRLRHGLFYVECPGNSLHDVRVYEAHPYGDGIFDSDERDYYLRFAVKAINEWIDQGKPNSLSNEKPLAPDVDYEVIGGLGE
jgi:hypothetical protein